MRQELPTLLHWPYHAYSKQMKGKLGEGGAWFVYTSTLKTVEQQSNVPKNLQFCKANLELSKMFSSLLYIFIVLKKRASYIGKCLYWPQGV